MQCTGGALPVSILCFVARVWPTSLSCKEKTSPYADKTENNCSFSVDEICLPTSDTIFHRVSLSSAAEQGVMPTEFTTMGLCSTGSILAIRSPFLSTTGCSRA